MIGQEFADGGSDQKQGRTKSWGEFKTGSYTGMFVLGNGSVLQMGIAFHKEFF